MSEQGKPDHWGNLLSDLGVDAPPQEPTITASAAEPMQSVPEPVPRPKPSRQPRPAEPHRSPRDWFRLATELGVEVPDVEVQSEPAEAEPPMPPEPVQPLPLPGEEWLEPSEPSLEARESLAEAEMALEELDRWDTESEVSEPPPTEREESERKLRRRRKRRRKTRRSDESAAVSAEPSQEDNTADLVEAEVVDIVEEEDVEEPIGDTSPAADRGETGDESVQKRSKRRRRRRSGRKKGSQEGAPPGSTAEAPVLAETGTDELDTDDIEEDVDEEDAADDSSEGRRRDKRALHRGIPTWKEAVDVVISANLESRAKRPDRGPGPRGRGGRNRGGRDRSDRNG
ncbi:MAG: hypothetical protein HUU20_11620 [Pirellulales bacterium]|nr:hypothetical protein [Pirellulales bacterium]